MSKKNKSTKSAGGYLEIHRIHWLDANAMSGWHKLTAVDCTLILIESVGWLIAENDTAVSLAVSRTEYRAGEVLTIPKVCIVDRWKL